MLLELQRVIVNCFRVHLADLLAAMLLLRSICVSGALFSVTLDWREMNKNQTIPFQPQDASSTSR